MIEFYNVNGEIVPAASAALRVSDLAILRGYGIFDYFLLRGGRPLFIDDYLGRFFRSAELLHLEPPVSRRRLHEQIMELIEANGRPDGGMRLLLTGGYSDDGYTPVAPNLLIMQYPVSPPAPGRYDAGVRLISHAYRRDLPEVKTINYLEGIRLIPRVKEAGALEPLYHQGGLISEAVRSNFFLVTADETLVTPASGILFGITRRKVLEVARRHFAVEERDVALSEFATAREAFLTGSNKGILPVVQVDGQRIGDGRPGPVTRRLTELFEALVEEYVGSAVNVK